MKIFEGIKKVVSGLYQGAEFASVIHTGAEIATGELGGDGKNGKKSGRKSNSWGFGWEDELGYFLCIWKATPAIQLIVPEDAGHEGELNRMIQIIGTLPEGAQGKIVLILGGREETVTMGSPKPGKETTTGKGWKENPIIITREMIVEKMTCNQDGAKCIQVFLYFLRNNGKPDGEKNLEALLRNGVVSEPAKRIIEAMDGAGKIIMHALEGAGLTEEKCNDLRDQVQESTLTIRARRLQRIAARQRC